MTLIEKLSCEPPGIQKTGFVRPIVSLHESKFDPPGKIPNSYSQDEYRLQVVFEITFMANRAQYARARKQAEHVFARRVFREILDLVDECRHATYNQDSDAIFAALDAIQREILG